MPLWLKNIYTSKKFMAENVNVQALSVYNCYFDLVRVGHVCENSNPPNYFVIQPTNVLVSSKSPFIALDTYVSVRNVGLLGCSHVGLKTYDLIEFGNRKLVCFDGNYILYFDKLSQQIGYLFKYNNDTS